MLNEIAHTCASIADDQGLYGDFDFIKECAFIHAEVSEALEAYKHGEPMVSEEGEGYLQEIADVLIYSLSLLGKYRIDYGLDIDNIVNKKIEYNKTREYRHGRVRE